MNLLKKRRRCIRALMILLVAMPSSIGLLSFIEFKLDFLNVSAIIILILIILMTVAAIRVTFSDEGESTTEERN